MKLPCVSRTAFLEAVGSRDRLIQHLQSEVLYLREQLDRERTSMRERLGEPADTGLRQPSAPGPQFPEEVQRAIDARAAPGEWEMRRALEHYAEDQLRLQRKSEDVAQEILAGADLSALAI